jgi:hypothetical protein
VHVTDLSEREVAIKAHFSSPEVQYIGSTSKCGCDFPHQIIQNSQLWPELDAGKFPKRDADASLNCKGLIELLQSSGENSVELYGVWDGNFMESPQTREVISAERLLDPHFYFKEQGFYTLQIG